MCERASEKIGEFWKWFASVCDALAARPDDPAIRLLLDERVRSFGRIVWEVGPGTQKPNALVISPGGRSELLPLTRDIIAHAPACEKWEFHASKPPKQWNRKFSLRVDNDTNIQVDANNWQYVLLRFPDRSFDVIIRAPGMPASRKNRQTAARIAVEGELGELKSMEWIRDIDVVDEFEDRLKGSASPFATIAAHLLRLTNE